MDNRLKHILIWAGYGLFLGILFTSMTFLNLAIGRVFIILFFQVLLFYLNLKWLMPAFYGKKKIGLFILINLGLVTVSALLSGLAMGFFVDLIPHPEHIENIRKFPRRMRSPFRRIMRLELLFTHSLPAILGLLTSMMLFNLQETKRRDEEQALSLEAEKDFLVSQINPHFLFNALNNIYAFTLDNPKGSAAILQLSQMLDYSLYRGQERSVTLEQEINYIENYIGLFKLKDDEIDTISFSYADADLIYRISPMLLVPFIENAFKHGNIENIAGTWIKIELKTQGNRMYFKCENTFDPQGKNKEKGQGIGIRNVRRRLELLYPEKHELAIDYGAKTQPQYTVSLTLESHEAELSHH